jgi:hypothetical protein
MLDRLEVMTRPAFVLCVVALAGCGSTAGSKPPPGGAGAGTDGDATAPGAAGADAAVGADVAPDVAGESPAPSADAGMEGASDGGADAGDGPGPVLVPYHALGVALADAFACALRDDHSVLCWGTGAPTVTPPRGRTVTVLGAAGSRACALLDDGGVTCWSLPYNATSTVSTPVALPAGRRAIQLAVGKARTCVILDDRTVFCAGPPNTEVLLPPAGAAPIRQIAVGFQGEVGTIYEDGLMSPELTDSLATPTVLFGKSLVVTLAASAGSLFWCWVKREGGTACERAPSNVNPDPTLPLVQIVAGEAVLCGIKVDGGVRCWGTAVAGCAEGNPSRSYWCDGQASADHAHDVLLGQPAVALAVSSDLANERVCALLADGTVKCWGNVLDCTTMPSEPCIPPATPDPIQGASLEVVEGPMGRSYGAWRTIDLGSHPPPARL